MFVEDATHLDVEEAFDKRNPVLKEALAPILFILKVFGLYYEYDKNTTEGKTYLKKCSRWYCCGVLLLLLLTFAKCVTAIFYQDSKNGYYLAAIFAVYYSKCFGQSFACLRMSSSCSNNILQDFINRVEVLLSKIKLCNCKLVENHFKRRVRIWLYVFVVAVLGLYGLKIFMAIYHSRDLELHNKVIAFPMPVTTWSFVVQIALDIYAISSFFLPTALCGVLTQSLSYTFDEYYRYLRYRGQNGLCLRTYIKEIRQHFITLTNLCCDLDIMLAWIFLISYLMDISLICLLLRVGVYGFTDITGRFALMLYVLPPTFSLIILSHHSSGLFCKGQDMLQYMQKLDISNVDMDAKVELDLLLFHLSSQPVVLTIWKMVPLYKSVIVSIFVSIITYFTLIIAL